MSLKFSFTMKFICPIVICLWSINFLRRKNSSRQWRWSQWSYCMGAVGSEWISSWKRTRKIGSWLNLHKVSVNFKQKLPKKNTRGLSNGQRWFTSGTWKRITKRYINLKYLLNSLQDPVQVWKGNSSESSRRSVEVVDFINTWTFAHQKNSLLSGAQPLNIIFLSFWGILSHCYFDIDVHLLAVFLNNFQQLLEKETSYSKQIRKDIDRTFPKHILLMQKGG